MTKRAERWVAVVTIAAFVQMGCYNTYFISKDELEKLESGVEVKEVVTVHADCEAGGSVAQNEVRKGRLWAQTESSGSSKDESKSGSDEKASDATPPSKEAADEKASNSSEKSSGKKSETSSAPSGCTKVPVSTANAISVVMDNGETRRVTPFNFMMSEQQIVAPEYDLLVSLDNVKGAQVRDFSVWKTIVTGVGVAAVSIGTFVGISLTSEEKQF